MAIDAGAIETAVSTAVKNELDALFDVAEPPTDTATIYTGVASAVAKGVRVAVEAIRDTAEVTVTDVAVGAASASGTIE